VCKITYSVNKEWEQAYQNNSPREANLRFPEAIEEFLSLKALAQSEAYFPDKNRYQLNIAKNGRGQQVFGKARLQPIPQLDISAGDNKGL
jgi:hypothetical protein